MDPNYFDPSASWTERLARLRETITNKFRLANVEAIERWAVEHGVRVVINIGADALLALLKGDWYRNKYDLVGVVAGQKGPSPRRLDVDKKLGFTPDGRDWYFGAVALGGTGVRFYGEYCLVLRTREVERTYEDGYGDTISRPPQLFDRNSFDLTDPPLKSVASAEQILRAEWPDLMRVLVMRTLSSLKSDDRLVTLGTIAELVLHDEDFIEVHLHRPPGSNDRRDSTRKGLELQAFEEVRQAPEDIAAESHIESSYFRGHQPGGAELVWAARRGEVSRQLAKQTLATRVVTQDGRGARWR